MASKRLGHTELLVSNYSNQHISSILTIQSKDTKDKTDTHLNIYE